jgi:hypothetical protein
VTLIEAALERRFPGAAARVSARSPCP